MRARTSCSGWDRYAEPSVHGIWDRRALGVLDRLSVSRSTSADRNSEENPSESTPGITDSDVPNGAAPGPARQDRTRLEAVLFLAKSPLSLRKLAVMADLEDATRARTLVGELNQLYDAQGRGIRIESIAGGYRLMTRAAVAPWLSRLGFLPPAVRLSWPMMETLAVVAYRQEVTRADMEAVRGVACGDILRQLMQMDLVRISGRSEDLGRPYLYGTTKRFLKLCGLPSIKALPPIDWHSSEDDLSEPEPSELERAASAGDKTVAGQGHPEKPAGTLSTLPVSDSPHPRSSVPKESDVSIVATETLATATGASQVIDPPAPGNAGPDQEQSLHWATDQDPHAVIEDEEDDLYERGLEDDDEDDDDIDDDWDDELDEDDEDLDDEDESIEDEDDDDWEEVDDDDADEDWDEDEDDDDWDDDAADDDEDWND